MLSATKICGLNDLLLVVLYLTANMSPLLKATKFINITNQQDCNVENVFSHLMTKINIFELQYVTKVLTWIFRNF